VCIFPPFYPQNKKNQNPSDSWSRLLEPEREDLETDRSGFIWLLLKSADALLKSFFGLFALALLFAEMDFSM